MKDLKNILLDFWNLLFPLFVRVFLSYIILLFLLVDPSNFLTPVSIKLQYFFESSHSFLESLKIDDFFALYLLVLLLLIAITFNKFLIIANSLIRISIGWNGRWTNILPDEVCLLSDYFPGYNTEKLESQIQMIYSKNLMSNEHNLKGENEIIEKEMSKYPQMV